MQPVSTSAPRAPSVTTMGPAIAAPMANDPTFRLERRGEIRAVRHAGDRDQEERDRERARQRPKQHEKPEGRDRPDHHSLRSPDRLEANECEGAERRAGREGGPEIAGDAPVYAEHVHGEIWERHGEEAQAQQVQRPDDGDRPQRGSGEQVAQACANDRAKRSRRRGRSDVERRDARDQSDRSHRERGLCQE